ncbi:MAG: T9SS type A sorting domain-containing protein [Flavobacteriales bacterium]
MKRNYAMILGSLLATASMAQWQHVGLEGISSTMGGVQVVDGSIYFHSAEDNGTIYRSEDKGATWEAMRYADDGRSWQYQDHKRTQYVNFGSKQEGARGLYRMLATENMWTPLNTVVTNLEVLDSGRLVASTNTSGAASIIISDQMGSVWSPTFQAAADARVRLVGRDGQGRLLVQAYDENIQNDLGVGLFRSSDDGDSWQRINGIKHDLTNASSNPDHSIYGSNGLRVMRSFDDGEKWSTLSVTFPYASTTGSRVFNMGGGHVFFMCHEQGATVQGNLYESFNNGDNWTRVDEEISQHLIYNMARDNEGNVYAATDNGVYRLHLAVTTSVNEVKANVTIHAYPMPTSDNVIVNAGGAMITELRVFDGSSREVMFKPNVDKPAEMLYVGHLSPGIYILRAVTSKGIATTPVVVE